ncbi:MAG TPA: HEAT repeat domain-containing protein [Vicinamibacterales bacterium]
MRVALIAVIALAVGFAGAVWYYHPDRLATVPAETAKPVDESSWIDQLYSHNPTESEEAARLVETLGVRALPTITMTLKNPGADRERVKAALKACGIIGEKAAPVIADVAARLNDPELTPEAAVALSFMGSGAFAPLRDAAQGSDPVVRREALRAIGKLKGRAALDSDAVLPLLVHGMADEDAGVRAIAATYLGIIHEGGAAAVEALMDGLKDEEPEVRRCSATALGSFGADAAPALPALRRAMGDSDQEVAREAGVAVVKLQERRP